VVVVEEQPGDVAPVLVRRPESRVGAREAQLSIGLHSAASCWPTRRPGARWWAIRTAGLRGASHDCDRVMALGMVDALEVLVAVGLPPVNLQPVPEIPGSLCPGQRARERPRVVIGAASGVVV